MGQTDKQFSGFLRMMIRDLKDAIAGTGPERKQAMPEALLSDLQTTLED